MGSLVLVALLLAGGSFTDGFPTHAPGPTEAAVSPSPSPVPGLERTTAAPAQVPAGAHPSARPATNLTHGRGTFFSNYNVPNPPGGFNSCAWALNVCNNETLEPALNVTSDGYTVLAYTAFTNLAPCPGQVVWATTEVGVVVSKDFGLHWTKPSYLGNPVCRSGPDENYSSAFEPSLTSLPNGTLVMSYVEWNLTASVYASFVPYERLMPAGILCGDANSSRIVVTESHDHGGNWTVPHVIDGGAFDNATDTCPLSDFPVVRPKITATGDTVYLVWTNVTNPVGYNSSVPYSSWVHFADSTDGGSTWSAIQHLVVLDNNVSGTRSDVATDPSILVDPSGKLFVAYATNFTSATYCGPDYCESSVVAGIEIAESTDNGTSWSYTTADATLYAGEPIFPDYPAFWEPFTTMAENPVLHQVYLVFQASVVGNFCQNGFYFGDECGEQEVDKVFLQNSSDAGATWSAPRAVSPYNTTADWLSAAFNPSVAVDSAGRIQVQYSYLDDQLCQNSTPIIWSSPCGPEQEYYLNSSDNGFTWTPPVLVAGDFTYHGGPWRGYMWDGDTTALATEGSQVLLAWTETRCPTNQAPFLCNLPDPPNATGLPDAGANVVASRLFESAGLTVTFNETGLPPIGNWSLVVQGYARDGPVGTNLSVSGLPPSTPIWIYVPVINASYGQAYWPRSPVVSPAVFTANTTVPETFAEHVLVNLLTVPDGYPSSYWDTLGYTNVALTPAPGAYWVPVGVPQRFNETTSAGVFPTCYQCDNMTFLSWTGTGPGSVSTNTTSVTFTPWGPVNETANFQLNGYCWGSAWFNKCVSYTYNLTFAEQGLPAETAWGVTVTDSNGTVDTGETVGGLLGFTIGEGLVPFAAWTIPAGGGRFWVPSTSTVSPVASPSATTVAITYRLESLTGVSFPTTFDAVGLPAGTSWGIELGVQEYGVNAANASFSLPGGVAESVNGTPVYEANGTGYYVQAVSVTPLVLGENASSLTPGGTFTTNGSAIVTLRYAPMFRLTVTASTGGSVSPADLWAPQGATVPLGEAPAAGYEFVGWTGLGSGSVSTSATNATVSLLGVVTEFGTFRPIGGPVFGLTLIASGLPTGTTFLVGLGGTTYSGTGSFRVANLSQGVYPLLVPTVYANGSNSTRFVSLSTSSSLPLSGDRLNLTANGTLTIVFGPQYAVSLRTTPGGSVAGAGLPSPGVYWWNGSEELTAVATASPGFQFLGWNGSGAGSLSTTDPSLGLPVIGPIAETAQFAPAGAATYVLVVQESGLPEGTNWSVTAGTFGVFGATSELRLAGLNGSYAVSAPPVSSAPGVRWVSNVMSDAMTVFQDRTIPVTFVEQFEVTVLAGVGGTASPIGSEWVGTGTVVALAAVPNESAEFLGWVGSGPGSYTGPNRSVSLAVSSPILEAAEYGPSAPGSNGVGPSGLPVLDLAGVVTLGVLGLLVGIGVARRRPPSTGGTLGAPEMNAPAEPDGQGPIAETTAPADGAVEPSAP